jgi:flagellar motility protein MotE (MotC chaperone)
LQAKIVYIAMFIMAFLFTTAAMYILSNNYKNIFKFDFTPVKDNVVRTKIVKIPGTKVDVGEIKSYLRNQFQKEIHDSLSALKKNKGKDTVLTALIKEVDSLKRINKKLDKTQMELAAREKEIQNLKSFQTAKEDSAYIKWKKEMAKVYEQMDPKAAARIIQNMPENSAKDILYSMKSKKAGKIYQELNPEFASRLTRNK